MKKNKRCGKFLLGAAVGVGIGMMFAPKKGSEIRKELKAKLDELIKKAKEIDVDSVKKEIIKKVAEIKSELEDLDREKVLKIAKKQGEILQKKAEELWEYAKKKGIPALEKTTEEIKNQTVKVAKEVIKKLENPEKANIKKISKK